MTPAGRLIARLRAEHDLTISDQAQVRRTHAGLNQRQAGAWSWFLDDPEHRSTEYGSHLPVTKLLRHKAWTVTEDYSDRSTHPRSFSVDPAEEPRR